MINKGYQSVSSRSIRVLILARGSRPVRNFRFTDRFEHELELELSHWRSVPICAPSHTIIFSNKKHPHEEGFFVPRFATSARRGERGVEDIFPAPFAWCGIRSRKRVPVVRICFHRSILQSRRYIRGISEPEPR